MDRDACTEEAKIPTVNEQPDYAAIYGRNAALSLAELTALGEGRGFQVSPLNQYAVRLRGFDLRQADHLGAITKIIELQGVAETAEQAVMRLAGTAPSAKKIRFGVSSYSSVPATPLNKLMKKSLTKRGVSSGFVMKREGKSGRNPDGELSAVQVFHNHLIGKGFDWCVFETDDGWAYGKTAWVYDFAGFGKRDYDKPVSDSHRGMLPPQLARAMINIGTRGLDTSVCDPFCGVGALLIESVTLGYETHGSDIDPKAVDGAQKNLTWLGREFDIATPWDVFVHDATQVLPLDAPTTIVTEGYLGEPLTAQTTDADIETEARHIETLLEAFLTNVRRSLSTGGRLVLTVPAWRLTRGERRLGLVDRVAALGYTKKSPLPERQEESSPPGLTARQTLDVARPGQRVIHELMILEKA